MLGTYLHGLFANHALRRAFLVHLAAGKGAGPDERWGAAETAAERYDRLADIVGAAIDMREIGKLLGLEFRDGNRRVE